MRLILRERTVDITDHQAVICENLCEGRTVKEISNHLGLSLRTMESQVEVLKGIMGAKNLPHLVALYLRAELAKPSTP